MTKKKSSKGTPTQVNGNRGAGSTEPPPPISKKRTMDEIDEIFSSKKIKKAKPAERNTDSKRKSAEEKKNVVPKDGKGQSLKSSKSKNEKGMSARKNKLPDDGDLFGNSVNPQKKLGGMKIYTEEELGLNRADAGNTPLCPFDCDCCF